MDFSERRKPIKLARQAGCRVRNIPNYLNRVAGENRHHARNINLRVVRITGAIATEEAGRPLLRFGQYLQRVRGGQRARVKVRWN